MDELVAHRADLAAKPLEVHGVINALQSHDGQSRFQLTGGDSVIHVNYRGLLPSTVTDAAQVVVVGRVHANDGLVADTVLSKVFF